MTAEVVALNKSAAAMAADSKATVRINGVVKTHDTVNKLFTLSKYHPVGVMIYGNAEMMGNPWETIIKIYRDRLRRRCFPRLSRYGHDFISCIILDHPSSSTEQEQNVYWMARDFVEMLVKGAEAVLEENTKVAPVAALRDVLQTAVFRKNSALVLRNFRDISANNIKATYIEALTSAFRDVVVKDFHQDFENDFVELLADLLRRKIPSEGVAGVVFAGFGDKEIYPAAKSYLERNPITLAHSRWL